MPDKRAHRGAHPRDEVSFAAEQLERLRTAVSDFCWLLTKGYAEKSALKLVGDRYDLTQRQRLAVMRGACSQEQRQSRKSRQVDIVSIAGQVVLIDGYNLLISIEAALSGGVILCGMDGTCRDLSGIHGTYRKVAETLPALELIGDFIHTFRPGYVYWFFDKPVSNSGRLKQFIETLSAEKHWPWSVELLNNPDRKLIESEEPAVSSDSVVLDGCRQWVNLAAELIRTKITAAWIIDLKQ